MKVFLSHDQHYADVMPPVLAFDRPHHPERTETAMARMLGSSRTIPWKLCRCRQCRVRREKSGRASWFAMAKRSARGREGRLWRREARSEG